MGVWVWGGGGRGEKVAVSVPILWASVRRLFLPVAEHGPERSFFSSSAVLHSQRRLSSIIILSVGQKMAAEADPGSKDSSETQEHVSKQGMWLWILDLIYDMLFLPLLIFCFLLLL